MTCKGLKQDFQVIRIHPWHPNRLPVDKAHATKIVLHGRIGVPASAINGFKHRAVVFFHLFLNGLKIPFIRKLNEVEPVETWKLRLKTLAHNLLKGYKRQDKIVTRAEDDLPIGCQRCSLQTIQPYPTFPRPWDHPPGAHEVLGKDVLQGFLHLLRLVVIEASLPTWHIFSVPAEKGQPKWHGMTMLRCTLRPRALLPRAKPKLDSFRTSRTTLW